MKIRPQNQSGVAVIVMVVLIAVVLIYLAVTARTLHWLGRELRLIEKQQIRQATNAPARPPTAPSAAIPIIH
jgi:hypothetical protein